MPLQMQTTGGGSAGGVLDLYSPYMQQQQQQQAQKQADWQAVMNAFQQFAKMKAENDFLKQQGIVGQKPVMGTFDQNTLNKAQGNMGNFSPEAQAQLQQMAQEKVNYPTGKTQPFFDPSKIPPGMKITIPGTGFEMTGQRQGIETIPEGFEITGYNADGRPFVKKVKAEQEAIVSDTGEIIGYRPVGSVFQQRTDPTEAILAALAGSPKTLLQPPKSSAKQSFSLGQKVRKNNKNYEIVGFDADGEPLVNEIK